MVWSKSFEYNLGKGFDPEALCHEKLQEVSGHKIPRSQGTGAYNAAYGGVCLPKDDLVASNQGWLKTHEYPCHRKVEYLNNISVMYNRFTKDPGISETARRRYFDWLMSDDSPWRTFSARRETSLPKDWTGTKQEYIYQYGWVWSGMDWPANLQHNFLVAQRMAAEWPKMISKWHFLVGLGCDPAVTFLMLDVLKPVQGRRGKDNRVLFKMNHTIQYDWPLNVCTSDEKYAWNFIHGKVDEKKLIQPFKDNPQYRPVNEIFGSSCKSSEVYPLKVFSLYNRDSGTVRRLGTTEEETREIFKGRMGFSKFQYDKYWCVYENELIEIINLENERLRNL